MKQAFVLGAGFSADHQFPLIRGLKERTIHFVEAERHSSYRSFLEPRDRFPKGLFYAGFEELLLKLAEAKRLGNASGPASIVGKVMRIGAARLIWCMTYFIWKVETAY